MPRIIRIDETVDDSTDIKISAGKSKKRLKNEAGLHYKTPASSLFLRDVVRTIKTAGRRHTGKHRFVKNAAKNMQRVIVKSRFVCHHSAQNGLKSLRDHCGYFTRKGVADIGHDTAEIYNGAGRVEAGALDDWLQKAAGDRHHFRFIVSPENSRNLDLTAYTRDLVAQLERDLGTRLDYLAVNHFNTDTPHAHLIIRGVDEKGKDLVISRDYIANGVRNRAREIATGFLGPRSELELKIGITREVDREAFTSLDRDLKTLAARHPDAAIDLRTAPGRDSAFAAFRRAARAQRLKFLESLGLATETSPGVWKLREECEQTLRELGMRNDIIKTMHRSLAPGNNQEKQIYNPSLPELKSITGVVIEKGVADELRDSKYLIVSATDTRLYYVPLVSKSEAPEQEARPGNIVTISPGGQDGGLRTADRKIIAIAAANNGIYSPETHRLQINRYRLPHGVTVEQYLENYRKRLHALERRGLISRAGEAAWRIPAGLEKRLRDRGGSYAKITLESTDDFARQVHSPSPTWLDRELAAGRLPQGTEAGSSFTRDLDRAKAQRLATLMQRGIAFRTGQGLTVRRDFVEQMDKERPRNGLKPGRNDRGLDR